MYHPMTQDEYDSHRAELAAEDAWERRRIANRTAHPDPRDPEYVEWDEEEEA